MKFKFRLILLCFLFIGNSELSAQNTNLKKISDENWIEYLVPRFMNDVTNYGENMSPHYVSYSFVSKDRRVTINILVNNSSNPSKFYKYNLKNSYASALRRSDLMVDYKVLKADKYYVSGNLTNGKILYQFAHTKYGYGYTYTLEYDRSYKDFFDKNLIDIIKGFKILN